MKKIIYILFLASLLIGITGCDDYLDVNKNVDAPDYVSAELYLAGIQQSYNGIDWDIRALGPLTQMMGTNSSTYISYGLHSFALGSDAASEVWRFVYWLQGMNLENLINQSIEAEEWHLAGIGYAMKAFSWDMMTKEFVDLPMKQAFVPGLLAHEYDYQKDIYPQVREWAYKAIECLEKEDNTNYGTRISKNDYIYQGDADKWIKFAYAVIVRNLASLSNKKDFTSAYAQELLDCAAKSFQSTDDDATLTVGGGSQSAPATEYNNYWGTDYGLLSYTYFQHDYAVQVFTGTIPAYDETTGEKKRSDSENEYRPYVLNDTQIVCDTLVKIAGHYDPRVAVKLGTKDDPLYNNMDNIDSIKARKYYGGGISGTSGPIGTAPSFYGRNASSQYQGTEHDGIGRWIYRDDAPYILTTYAELKFNVAETYWKLGKKSEALAAFKEGVKADLAFTSKYIYPGTKGVASGGDKITKAVFNNLAAEYAAGPYVDGLSVNDFTLSHIMMQKWVALYPWGAQEAWVDMRKYHYDIKYSGEYPSKGDGWLDTYTDHKWDSDQTKVYKGFYLYPALVEGRKASYNIKNEGSPCYRLRPRYNSEYMWNVPSLEKLLPISGTADNYHCSIPWFAYPGDLPSVQ